MLFRVTHSTLYKYESPVAYCLSEVRITPRVLAHQQVLKTEIQVDPAPAFLRQRQDYFGNAVTSFGVFELHERFRATADSLVDVQPPPPVDPSITWEAAREWIAAAPGEPGLEALEFLYDSPYVRTSTHLSEYARRSFDPGRPMFEAVSELSHRIHEEFKYQPASTSIDMPLEEVLEARRGVCQDFAHVMIGALRSLRLSARYVSGYLRTGANFQGAQASHAWVSVYFPGSGWLNFDPTNDLMPSDSHVTVAWGRDYGDVPPVKGITLGGGTQIVNVEVYVKPVSAA